MEEKCTFRCAVSGNCEKLRKKTCTISFSFKDAFSSTYRNPSSLSPINKEVLEVVQSHLKKSFNLKIHMLSDSGAKSTFWLQTSLAGVSTFVFVFQLNFSLQLAILLKTKHSIIDKADIFSYVKHVSRSLWTISACYMENDQFLHVYYQF